MDGGDWALCFEATMGLPDLPPFSHIFLLLFFRCREWKDKKIYSHAFCLSLSLSLAVRLGTRHRTIAQEHWDRRETPSSPSPKPILSSVIVHKFLNVEGKSDLVSWDRAVAEPASVFSTPLFRVGLDSRL